MATCYNKNTKEYKSLLKEYKNPLMVDTVIMDWQLINTDDSMPSIMEARSMIKDQDMLNSAQNNKVGQLLLSNLRSKDLLRKVGSDYFIVSNISGIVEARQTAKLVRNYLSWNGFSEDSILFRKTKTVGMYRAVINEDIINKGNINYNSNNSIHSLPILDHLVKKFPNTKYEILNEQDAKVLYDQIPNRKENVKGKNENVEWKDINSFFFAGTAILIKGRVDQNTAVEEMIHPFIDAMLTDNVELFDKLHTESATSFPELKASIDSAYSSLKFTESERRIELVTQSLSQHFSEEFDTRPQIGFLRAVKEFLTWFSDVVKSLYSAIAGKKLTVKSLNSNMSLSDVGRMLNTKDLAFELNPSSSTQDVRYSLNKETKNTLKKLKELSATEVQKEIIDQLFHQATSSSFKFEDLSTSRVTALPDGSGRFLNVDTDQELDSAENSIIGAAKNPFRDSLYPFKSNTDAFINGVVLGVPFANAEINAEYKDIYNHMLSRLDGMRSVDRSIFIPNVIVSDDVTGIATTIDFLKVDPFGNLQIINFESSKASYKDKGYHNNKFDVGEGSFLKKSGLESITPKMENSVKLSLSARMLENLGFEINDGSISIHIRNNVVEGTTLHSVSENDFYVDKFIPLDIAEENKMTIDGIMDQMRNPEETVEWEDEELTEEGFDTTENNPTYESLLKGLRVFNAGIISNEEAQKSARNVLSMDKSKTSMLRKLSMTRALIENLALNPDDIYTVHLNIVKESIDQIDEFVEYISDPSNFRKEEYISKVLAWQKFVERYRGLVDLAETEGLSSTQLTYIQKLTSKLNKVVGTTRGDGTVISKGVISLAIDNYVRATIKEKSNFDWSEAQLEELMTSARDIGYIEYQTGDMSTSRDTILALMDKIYKRDRQIVLERVQKRAPKIKRAALVLAQLSPTSKIDYSFMLQMIDGLPTGRYVKKIGKQFNEAFKKSKEGLTDDNGGWKSLIDIEDLDDHTDEEINWNKEIFAARETHFAFKKAEIITESGPIDGNYYKYTDEFKRARSRFEIFIPNGNGGGFWSPKSSVSNKAWLRYVAKYFNTYNEEDGIQRPVQDMDGNPTGQVENVRHLTSVKADYKEIKDVARNPKTGKKIEMRSEKWLKLQNPKTELEKAQSSYYNMFIDIYEGELMDLLPENTQMIGQVPRIMGKPVDSLKDKPNLVGSLYSRLKTKVTNWFHPSTVIKKTFTDENGDIITDSLPLFYTGSLSQTKDIEAAHLELDAAQELFNEAKTDNDQVKAKKAIKAARGKIKNLEAKPSALSLNLDMTESLLKFSAMAENYEVMSQSEDTYTAMIKVLENRNYTDWKGNTRNVDDEDNEVGVSGRVSGQMASNVTRRAKKWMKMVYYNNDHDTKTFFDKLTKGIITGTSLAYVGFNIFGNLNNYVFGRVSNAIETAGGRFFDPKAMFRAVNRFNTVGIPGKLRGMATMKGGNARFKDNASYDKYNAIVLYLNMLDSKEDMRESQYKSDNKSFTGTFKDMFTEQDAGSVVQFLETAFDGLHEVGYVVQDAGEYNVQTKIGHAIVESTTVKNSSTGETLSLYDAYVWDSNTMTLKVKEGFDKIIYYNQTKERDFNDDARYELRNYIREVNKQVHGNYAHEDRMVMQSTAVGQLAAQFHKWVAPSIKTRFRPAYFDENLGWMEGRYLSFWNFMSYSFKNINEIGKLSSNYKAFNGKNGQIRLQNAYRTLGEIGILMTTFALKIILTNMFGDNDDDEEYDYAKAIARSQGRDSDSVHTKRLRNVLLYQLDRTHKDLITFIPIPGLGGLQQMYQMFKSPIASTRTMGELGQALESTVGTGLAYAFMDDQSFMESKYVYQRTKRKGQMKLGKEWGDALPILYTINRYKSYDTVKNFNIK